MVTGLIEQVIFFKTTVGRPRSPIPHSGTNKTSTAGTMVVASTSSQPAAGTAVTAVRTRLQA